MVYEWAINKTKLDRAIKETRNGSEQQVKDYYILLGGLVKEVAVPVELTQETVTQEVKVEESIQTSTIEINPLKCQFCEFIGKNANGLRLHNRKHNAKQNIK